MKPNLTNSQTSITADFRPGIKNIEEKTGASKAI